MYFKTLLLVLLGVSLSSATFLLGGMLAKAHIKDALASKAAVAGQAQQNAALTNRLEQIISNFEKKQQAILASEAIQAEQANQANQATQAALAGLASQASLANQGNYGSQADQGNYGSQGLLGGSLGLQGSQGGQGLLGGSQGLLGSTQGLLGGKQGLLGGKQGLLGGKQGLLGNIGGSISGGASADQSEQTLKQVLALATETVNKGKQESTGALSSILNNDIQGQAGVANLNLNKVLNLRSLSGLQEKFLAMKEKAMELIRKAEEKIEPLRQKGVAAYQKTLDKWSNIKQKCLSIVEATGSALVEMKAVLDESVQSFKALVANKSYGESSGDSSQYSVNAKVSVKADKVIEY